VAAATAEQDTNTRLQAAQARAGALRAEASGLAEAEAEVLMEGDIDRYLRLMACEHAIPRQLVEHVP
jgi:hypothetical protein